MKLCGSNLRQTYPAHTALALEPVHPAPVLAEIALAEFVEVAWNPDYFTTSPQA
jgi:hypothetical protein